MKYDFTTIMHREGHDAIAVDIVQMDPDRFSVNEGFDVIPMWIADMNFPTAPSIVESMKSRIEEPHFGYFAPRKEYYDSIICWQHERHGTEGLEAKHIGYVNGVLGGVASALKVIASPGDKVLVHSPVYIGFTSVLKGNGYNIVHSPLKQDHEGIWRADLKDMEQKLKDEHIHAAILCSPHNPCGRVWEKEELEAMMELFRRYQVYVVSDEIWSDIIRPGYTHIPTQSVSEDAKQRTISLYAPSKTFNLAGLVGSYSIIYNDWLRDRFDKENSLTYYNSMNVLSMYALMGAYSDEGAEWTDEMCETIRGNVDYAAAFIRDHWEGISVMPAQGTYMLFVDCSAWCKKHEKTLDEVLKACIGCGVLVQDGRDFQGPCHIRMNMALPLSRVREAFKRLNQYVFFDE